MAGLVPLLLLAVPLAELLVLIRVTQEVGLGTALVLLVGVSVVGVWVAKAAGLGVLRRLQATVAAGRVPSNEVVDGFLVLVAGLLMVLPGFVTGAVAVVLLFPPTRVLVRVWMLRRVTRGATWVVGVRGGGSGPVGSAAPLDVDGWPAGTDARDRGRPPEGPGALGP